MGTIDIHFSKKIKNIALFTLFFLVITHAYRYFSPMYSHDSLMFSAESDAVWKISLGRFMQPVYWKLRGHIAAPYIVGMLSYLWLMLSVYTVSELLDIQSNMAQFLLAGVMTGSLALVSANAAYIHESDTFMLSLFLNVLAAFLFLRPVKRLWIFAPVLLAAGLALYQAYLQVYVALVMIWAIKQILAGDNCLRQTLLQCVKAAALLLLSMVIYAVTWKCVLKMTGISPESGYNGLTKVGHYEEGTVLNLLKGTWTYPFQYLWCIKSRNYWMVLVPRIVILTYAASATVYALVKRKRSVPEAVGVLGIMVLLPAGINCMYVISKGLIHDLIVYSYCFADVYAIAVTEYAFGLISWKQKSSMYGRIKKSIICVLPLMFCLVFFDKTLYANQIYLKKDLEYDATLSVMTRMMDRLEQLEGYEAGVTPVALSGQLEDSVLDKDKPAFAGAKAITGLGDNFAVTYSSTYWMYFRDVLGYPIVQAENEEDIVRQEAVAAMPSFPEKGSVALVDGVAVVKLSD